MPVKFVAEIQDADGDVASTSIRTEDFIVITNVDDYGVAWAQLLNNIIGGKVNSVTAYGVGDISGLTGNTIEPNSDVENIGAFQFLTAAGNRCETNIPAIDEVVANSLTQDNLDLSDPQVDAFLTAMEDGILIGATVIQPCDKRGDSIVSTVYAREEFRNSGARRRR